MSPLLQDFEIPELFPHDWPLTNSSFSLKAALGWGS